MRSLGLGKLLLKLDAGIIDMNYHAWLVSTALKNFRNLVKVGSKLRFKISNQGVIIYLGLLSFTCPFLSLLPCQQLLKDEQILTE